MRRPCLGDRVSSPRHWGPRGQSRHTRAGTS
jgi:hypothetical protein